MNKFKIISEINLMNDGFSMLLKDFRSPTMWSSISLSAGCWQSFTKCYEFDLGGGTLTPCVVLNLLLMWLTFNVDVMGTSCIKCEMFFIGICTDLFIKLFYILIWTYFISICSTCCASHAGMLGSVKHNVSVVKSQDAHVQVNELKQILLRERMVRVREIKLLVIVEGQNVALIEFYKWQHNLRSLALYFKPPGRQHDMSVIHRRQSCFIIIMIIWSSIK